MATARLSSALPGIWPAFLPAAASFVLWVMSVQLEQCLHVLLPFSARAATLSAREFLNDAVSAICLPLPFSTTEKAQHHPSHVAHGRSPMDKGLHLLKWMAYCHSDFQMLRQFS